MSVSQPRARPTNYRRDDQGFVVHPISLIQWSKIHICDKPDIEFINESLSESYKCGICMNILHKPVSIGCGGGHIFCKACILRSIHVQQPPSFRCPICRDPYSLRDVRDDNFAKRVIGGLVVKCPNHQMTQKHIALNQQRSISNRSRRYDRRRRSASKERYDLISISFLQV